MRALQRGLIVVAATNEDAFVVEPAGTALEPLTVAGGAVLDGGGYLRMS